MKRNEVGNANPLVIFITAAILFILFSVMFAGCDKPQYYDRDTCMTLLNKQEYMKEISTWSEQDSIAIYTSMEWKSNNVEILKHCRYYAQINELINN